MSLCGEAIRPDLQGHLFRWCRLWLRQPVMQALIARAAKLAEDLEITACASADTPRREQQLIEMAPPANSRLVQAGGHPLIAPAFIDTIFLVRVHAADPLFPAYPGQRLGRV